VGGGGSDESVVLIDRIQEREREGYEEITRQGERVETRRVNGMTWIKMIYPIPYHSPLEDRARSRHSGR
jgi:hypothetical protein